MRLRKWRPIAKGGALRGYCEVELPFGLILQDVGILIGRYGPWAALPSKPLLDRDGRHGRDINGKPRYAPVAKWQSRALADCFSTAVIELVLRHHPNALEVI